MDNPFENVNHTLYLQTILNTRVGSYQNILTVSSVPAGPLGVHVKRIRVPRLSQFQDNYSDTCVFALCKANDYTFSSDIPSVIGYLEKNGYKILQHEWLEEDRHRKIICVFSHPLSEAIL